MVHNTSTIHRLVNFSVALCGRTADMLLPLMRTGPVHVCPWVFEGRPSFTKPPPFTDTTDVSLSPFSHAVKKKSWFYMRVFLTSCSINFVEFTVCNHVKEVYFVCMYWFRMGTALAQWLSCCATIRKIAGPSNRTMALGSTQPLIEMSTRSIFWG